MSIEEQIYEEVKNRCSQDTNVFGLEAWTHHIKIVYEVAKKHATDYGADEEIVSLAALLHDIASVTNKDYESEHHTIGASIAEELLTKLDYPKDKIEQIKNCILHHRGSIVLEKNTPEEVCIADADAMAHFYSISSLFRLAFDVKELNVDDATEFVLNKLKRSYNKLSPLGKELIKPYYDAFCLILVRK